MADQGQRPAGWRKDPSGRHFGRWWDGDEWTEHVISAEKVQDVDPFPPADALPAVMPQSKPAVVSPATVTRAQPVMRPARPQKLASERVVVAAPMSFAGSAGRIWKLTDAGPTLLMIPVAVILVLMAWMVVVCWYLFFGLWLVPYRLIRRGGRKRKMEGLRHQEMLRAVERRQGP